MRHLHRVNANLAGLCLLQNLRLLQHELLLLLVHHDFLELFVKVLALHFLQMQTPLDGTDHIVQMHVNIDKAKGIVEFVGHRTLDGNWRKEVVRKFELENH